MWIKRIIILWLVLFVPTAAYSQHVVTVTGVPGEDENSSPRDPETGRIIGPETDNVFETFSAAVNFLVEHRGGGKVIVNAAVPVQGSAQTPVPLEIEGAPGGNIIAGSLTATGTIIVLTNVVMAGRLILTECELTASDAVFQFPENSSAVTALSVNNRSNINIRNSRFLNSINGILASGSEVVLDIQNTLFDGVSDKGIVAFLEGAASSVTVRDCTFTNGRIGVDARLTDGSSIYENLQFYDLDWVGLNIEPPDPVIDPPDTFTTLIQDCYFENIGYQGLHLHNAHNVTVFDCVATGCGVLDAIEIDGAGFGAHFGGNNLRFERCDSAFNSGSGFDFAFGVENIQLTDIYVEGNGNSGIKVRECDDVVLDDVRLIANVANNRTYHGGGVYLASVNNAIIRNCTFVENQSAPGGHGGGLYACISSFSVRDVTLFNNSARGNGGGIACVDNLEDSMLQFSNIRAQENEAGQDGGGVYIGNSLARFSGSTVLNNVAGRDGGGIAVVSALPKIDDWNMIDGNRIEGNQAERDGGGIYISNESHDLLVFGAPSVISAQQIVENTAGRNGGGICVVNSNPVIGVFKTRTGTESHAPNLITDNVAIEGNGGGIFVSGAFGEPVHQMEIIGGNIIQRNKADGQVAADAHSARIGNGGGIAFEESQNIFLGGDLIGNQEIETDNGNWARNNGGGLYAYRSIFSVGASTGPLSNEFIRGNVADEGNGGGIALVQTSLAPGDGEVRIFSAIVSNEAKAVAPSDIEPYASPVGNGGGVAIMEQSNNVTLEGSAISRVGSQIEDALYDPADGNTASNNGGGVYISNSNPTLRGLNIIANECYEGNGGGIAIVGSDLAAEDGLLERCIIQANVALGLTSIGENLMETLNGHGGGAAFINEADRFVLKLCVIGRRNDGLLPGAGEERANRASNGGGVLTFNSNPQFITDDPEVNLIRGNEARGYGGGIAIRGDSENVGRPLRLSRVDVFENEAGQSGGGISVTHEANAVWIAEALISENTAEQHGGGIYITASDLRIGDEVGTNRHLFHGGKVIVEKNKATNGHGGGIACEGDSNVPYPSELLIRGVVIGGNQTVNGNGGGIAFFGQRNRAKMQFNLIGYDRNGVPLGNLAPNGAGGGIYADASSPTIGAERGLGIGGWPPIFIGFPGLAQNIIVANLAQNGGGVAFVNGAEAGLYGNDIGLYNDPQLANKASRMGGGVYVNNAAPIIGPMIPPSTLVSYFIGGGFFAAIPAPVPLNAGGNRILNNEAQVGGAIAFENDSTGQVRWNVIAENRVTGGAGATGGIFVTGGGSSPHVTNNTVILNRDDGIRLQGGASPFIQNNIFDSNTGFGVTGPALRTLSEGGTFASNNVFNNSAGAYGPGTPLLTQSQFVALANIELDPLYVNRVGKDYRLTAESPCTPGNSPQDSQLIGALSGPIVQRPTDEFVKGGVPFRDAAFGDMNGNGWPDLVVATHGVDFVLWNSGHGVYEATQVVHNPVDHDFSNAVKLGDLNGNGYLDIVFANQTADVVVFNNGGDFETAQDRLHGSGASNNVQIADIDGDGHLDVLMARDGLNGLYLGVGDGNFLDYSDRLLGDERSVDFAIGDLNGNGRLDIYVANREADTVLLNDGEAFFTPDDSIPIMLDANCVAIGDIDNDGDLDIFIAGESGAALLLNNGDATFVDASSQLPEGLSEVRDAEFVDWNNNGVIDLILALRTKQVILLNDGQGNFHIASESPENPEAIYWAVDVADIDGDGMMDAVLVQQDGLEFFLNFTPNPASGLTAPLHVSPTQSPAGSLIVITSNLFSPSQRRVDIHINGIEYEGYLINNSRIGFRLPDQLEAGEHTLEIRLDEFRVTSVIIRVGELITEMQGWLLHR